MKMLDKFAVMAVVALVSFPALAEPVQEVPAPLPILGAVAAIGWGRKLRRRIRQERAQQAFKSLQDHNPAGSD